MDSRNCVIHYLFPEIRNHLHHVETVSSTKAPKQDSCNKTPFKASKSFVEAVKNVSDISIFQLLVLCVKRGHLATVIPKDEYLSGLEACKHNLYGRIIWTKRPSPLTVANLKAKLNLCGSP